MAKPENEGAITVTIKGDDAKVLRDLMSEEKRRNRKGRQGPTSYASIVTAALLERYKGELAEQRAEETRLTEELKARHQSPF